MNIFERYYVLLYKYERFSGISSSIENKMIIRNIPKCIIFAIEKIIVK